jgi:NADH-quinone oxidoreductase subunit L
VIHGLHGEQDLRQMGGLFKHMKITAITLFCASLAISGFPFTSGFFSKDAILVAAYERAPWMYWVGVLTAGMTAFYVFRAWFMAFTGRLSRPRASARIAAGDDRPADDPGGFVDLRRLHQRAAFLEPMFAERAENQGLAWLSAGVGILGILLAYVFYVAKRGWPIRSPKAWAASTRWSTTNTFVDEAYDATVVEPLIEGFANRALARR